MTGLRGATVRRILFDMDDVFYVYDRPARISVLSAETGLDAAFVERRIWTDGVEDAADAGAFATTGAYLAAWSDALGHPVGLDLWMRARQAGMTPIAGTFRSARRAAAAGLPVAVLTNNGPAVLETRHRLVPELAELVGERFTVSAQFGRRKPDPEVYRAACRHLGWEEAGTLFVDDRAENVRGAVQAGLGGHHFTGPEDLAARLDARHR